MNRRPPRAAPPRWRARAARRFPGRIRLPERRAKYDWREVATRMLPNGRTHRLKCAA